MFEYIRGTAAEIRAEKVIVDVGGIGYRINSTLNSTSQIVKGEIITVYTFLSVKEDDMSLYGFITREELEMFRHLLSVSKVGPKVAVGILSAYSPGKLKNYILNNDITSISKAPGVGKKTAERIILELKDKINKFYAELEEISGNDSNNMNEIVETLVVLGFSRQEGIKAYESVKDSGLCVEGMIKKALQCLMK